jgi:hypothetical protein
MYSISRFAKITLRNEFLRNKDHKVKHKCYQIILYLLKYTPGHAMLLLVRFIREGLCHF